MNYQFNAELANIYNKLRLNEAKKDKPDFLDVDKDGNRKESFKKATKDAKSKKHCSCGCVIGKPEKGCKCKKACK